MHSDEEASNLGGVNVPIVNFIGEDGFKISLQLKVANPKAEKESNLDINLDWKSNDENMKVTEKPKPAEVKVEETVVVKEVKESKPGFSAKVKNVPTSFKNKFKGARTKVSLSMKNIGKKKAIEVKTEDSSNKATIDEVKAEEKPSETLQTKVEEVLTEIKPADASKVDNAKNEVKSEESKK